MKQCFKKMGLFVLTLTLVMSFSIGLSTKAAQEGYEEIDEAAYRQEHDEEVRPQKRLLIN